MRFTNRPSVLYFRARLSHGSYLPIFKDLGVESMVSWLFVSAGVVLLYLGGEWLVRHAVNLASRSGISPLVIGLTVVAFGTSMPELAATVASSLQGAPALALGNVIGSNIANIGLILGLSVSLYALQGDRKFLVREIPLMIGISALMIPLLWDGHIGRLEGAVLLLLLAAYLWRLLRQSPTALRDQVDPEQPTASIWLSLLGATAGIVLLVAGARLLVIGAVTIATNLGVSEAVIGLTVVAFGTSLPELASSVVASLKRQTDIILGNIIGSNVFNVLAVLGVTAVIQPLSESFASISTDLIIMMGFSLALPLLLFRNYRLGRPAGIFLVIAYLLYVAYLYFIQGV